MATAGTERGRAPPEVQQNKLKSKSSVKKTETTDLYKSYERGRTKSGAKNKTDVGRENATLMQFLIGNEERGEKQKQEETTALITGRRESNGLKTEEDKLEYFGEILRILVEEMKELKK